MAPLTGDHQGERIVQVGVAGNLLVTLHDEFDNLIAPSIFHALLPSLDLVVVDGAVETWEIQLLRLPLGSWLTQGIGWRVQPSLGLYGDDPWAGGGLQLAPTLTLGVFGRI